MKSKVPAFLRKVKQASFAKNFMVLVTGNTVARLIPVIAVPFLSRIYVPKDFGLLELFNTVMIYTNALSSGNYESAIILPRNDRDAMALRKASVLLASAFALLCLMLGAVFKGSFVDYAKNENASYFVILVPVMIVLNTALQAQHQWAVRKENFRELTTSNVINTLLSTLFELGFGLVGLTGIGMILGSNLGNLSGLVSLTVLMRNKDRRVGAERCKSISLREIVSVMKEYIGFPKYKMAGVFLTRGVGSLPALFFTYYLSPELVGYYSLSKKLLGLPSTMIGQAAGNVFAGRAAKDFNERGECQTVYRRTFFLLLLFALPIFLGVFLLGPSLLPGVLGPEWENSGVVLRVLIPQYFFAFLSSPFIKVFSISSKLKAGFFWQASLFVLSFIILFFGTKHLSPHMAILSFAIGYSCMYILNLVITYRLAKKPD